MEDTGDVGVQGEGRVGGKVGRAVGRARGCQCRPGPGEGFTGGLGVPPPGGVVGHGGHAPGGGEDDGGFAEALVVDEAGVDGEGPHEQDEVAPLEERQPDLVGANVAPTSHATSPAPHRPPPTPPTLPRTVPLPHRQPHPVPATPSHASKPTPRPQPCPTPPSPSHTSSLAPRHVPLTSLLACRRLGLFSYSTIQRAKRNMSSPCPTSPNMMAKMKGKVMMA